MDQEILADKPPIQEGFEFLRRVIRGNGVTVADACWVRQTPDAFWNLWVFTQAEDDAGLLATYSKLAAALGSNSAVKLSRLRVVPATDTAALRVRLARLIASGWLLTLTAETLGQLGLDWHEAVIYPSLGPMDASEVTAFLARELNRAGVAATVTLTLADGQNIRGYPLAIRKSLIGGALVELADPETKLKGQEVPLDRISSIAYDQLAS